MALISQYLRGNVPLLCDELASEFVDQPGHGVRWMGHKDMFQDYAGRSSGGWCNHGVRWGEPHAECHCLSPVAQRSERASGSGRPPRRRRAHPPSMPHHKVPHGDSERRWRLLQRRRTIAERASEINMVAPPRRRFSRADRSHMAMEMRRMLTVRPAGARHHGLSNPEITVMEIAIRHRCGAARHRPA